MDQQSFGIFVSQEMWHWTFTLVCVHFLLIRSLMNCKLHLKFIWTYIYNFTKYSEITKKIWQQRKCCIICWYWEEWLCTKLVVVINKQKPGVGSKVAYITKLIQHIQGIFKKIKSGSTNPNSEDPTFVVLQSWLTAQ